MSKLKKYPAIESALRKYRGEDAPAEKTVTCPGCNLVFTPEQEQKSEEQPAAPAESRALSADEVAALAGDECRGALLDPEGFKRTAQRAQEHRAAAKRERASKAKPRSFAQLSSDYYGAPAASGDAVIPPTDRGGK